MQDAHVYLIESIIYNVSRGLRLGVGAQGWGTAPWSAAVTVVTHRVGWVAFDFGVLKKRSQGGGWGLGLG
jgi:hypothetical protein